MERAQLLTVCTGNICRSPVAEAALQRHLDAAGVPVAVRSAGTLGGIPSDRIMIKAARDVGYDLSSHASRRLTPELIDTDGADLIIAMDRGHVEQIVAMSPTAWTRTFTLAELARRAQALPASSEVGSFTEWVQLVGEGRKTADLLVAPIEDDIADPYGAGTRTNRRTATQIDELSRLISLLMQQQIALQPVR